MMQDISSKWQTILLLVPTRSLALLSSMPLLCKRKKERKEKEKYYQFFCSKKCSIIFNHVLFMEFRNSSRASHVPRSCITFHDILDFHDNDY
jgi:hypothetical protein